MGKCANTHVYIDATAVRILCIAIPFKVISKIVASVLEIVLVHVCIGKRPSLTSHSMDIQQADKQCSIAKLPQGPEA